jgi:hypothetical protein
MSTCLKPSILLLALAVAGVLAPTVDPMPTRGNAHRNVRGAPDDSRKEHAHAF